MQGFKIVTLGCKVNQAESDTIAWGLETAGWHPVSDEEDAAICILNTCAVTAKAAQQSRQAIRNAIRSHPNARILVTGCYAKVDPNALERIQGIEEIVDPDAKLRIPDLIRFGRLPAADSDTDWAAGFSEKPTRTRAFLKIQDGCNARCTYCIVPYARGRSRSMPPDAVLDHIRRLKDAGYHEVVLAGIHLGCYGMDQGIRLIDLLRAIDAASAMDRVRLSSIEPNELSDEIIEQIGSSTRFCRHFHIPLQSGDDTILQRMHRPYSRENFQNRILAIRERIPDAAIGVDVLAGFPGESEKAFRNSYDLIQVLPISYLHVFPFSPRHGTPASRFPDPVPRRMIAARSKALRRLGTEKKRAFYRSFLGDTAEVLVEGKRDSASGCLKGITSNYIPVLIQSSADLNNRLINVTLHRLENDRAVWGTVNRPPRHHLPEEAE